MNGRPIIITFVMLLLLAPVILQIAQPYEINPAKWVFYMKEDYEIKPIYFNFQIKNTDNGTIKVKLSTITPEYLYSDQYPGDQAFPDYSWITISESEVTVPAGQTVDVPVKVEIPAQYNPNGSSTPVSNYNKTYEAWFLADQTQGAGNIQVDYRCRWVFQTPTVFVPLSERPGYINYALYVAIIGIIIFIVAATWGVFVIKKRKQPTTNPKSKRKQKSDDDIFT